MDNVSVLSALIGFGIVIAVAAWMWRKQNSDRAARIAREAHDKAKAAVKDAAKNVRAKAKK